MPTNLREPWQIGEVPIPNQVVLAPLAGIGNWFVRLQAKRYGAGLAVSEMVSSFAIHYENEKTCKELLRIHPEEQNTGPVALQLFGHDPEIMRSAAKTVAAIGVDIIDINMGCPVPKVCKTGAGAALIEDPDTAVAVAKAARLGSGLPIMVKLRAGKVAGETMGLDLAHRLVKEAGVSAISFHPRPANIRHKGKPDYALAAELANSLDAPVILSGGMRDPVHIQATFESTNVAAVMLARGSLGNPWLFEEVLGTRDTPPAREEIIQELEWIIDCGVLHLGEVRAARYLRKFYPWYLERLGCTKREQTEFQTSETIADQRALTTRLRDRDPIPA